MRRGRSHAAVRSSAAATSLRWWCFTALLVVRWPRCGCWSALPAGYGWAALAIVIASQSLRWWCIATLGRQWNTRVIVVPGLPLVSRGPYRLLRHPNYVAVVLEGAALPLVHSAWATAAMFTILNAALLARRIQVEERALATVAGKAAALR
jgi:methyltransferase